MDDLSRRPAPVYPYRIVRGRRVVNNPGGRLSLAICLVYIFLVVPTLFTCLTLFLSQTAEVASGPAAHPAPSTVSLTFFIDAASSAHGPDRPASGEAHGVLLAMEAADE